MWVSGLLVYISDELKEQGLRRWQKTLHRAQAIGMTELQAAIWLCIPSHGTGMGTATTLTGSPLSPLTFLSPTKDTSHYSAHSGGRRRGVTFLPCRRVHSVAPVITGHIHAFNYSSQACYILQGARHHAGGVVHGLLSWVLTANYLPKASTLCWVTSHPSVMPLNH